MGLMTAIEVASSGLTAQRRRLEVLVSNLVNANTTQPEGKEPFRRKDVIFSSVTPEQNFGAAFDLAMSGVRGVEVSGLATDRSEPIKRYEPGHPHADKNGYVSYPNVNAMEEMVNVLSATRSYEANLQAVNSAKDMLQKTLEIIK
ncbi:MAG TPA: flagellar basal body rod protein FlgC [Acidobacteriota bacterium]|nr:flagellar basal body rod protein FlgC [Acidobacteriota bacterium]